MYAFDADFRTSRDNYGNIWTNGRPSAATTLDGVQFACTKWLGLLGLPSVLDTHTFGQLHVRITLAPSYVTTSINAAHSWGINDVFMRVKYYENYEGELPSYLEFDDFKSVLERSSTYNQKVNLLVNSSRIDYAIARNLWVNYTLKQSNLSVDSGTTAYFTSTADLITSWNISVNNNNLYRYKPSSNEGIQALKDIFKTRAVNPNQTLTTQQKAFDRCWGCGVELGFTSDIPQQFEIGYTTEGNATTVNFPILIVKTTSSLEIGSNGEIVHRV